MGLKKSTRDKTALRRTGRRRTDRAAGAAGGDAAGGACGHHPPGVLNTLSFKNTVAYRYYRYIGPANSYCDIAELQFDD